MIICKFENHNEAKLRHVVIDSIVLRENSILLVKRSPEISEGGKWGLIGGYMERDENLVESMRREVLEETGYEVDQISFLTVVDTPDRPNEDRQNISVVFVCQAGEKVGQPDWESTEQRWFELDNLPPPTTFAFDHHLMIELYLKDRQKPGVVPPVLSLP